MQKVSQQQTQMNGPGGQPGGMHHQNKMMGHHGQQQGHHTGHMHDPHMSNAKRVRLSNGMGGPGGPPNANLFTNNNNQSGHQFNQRY